MWRYEFLKFKFEISEGDFDMFSHVFETKYPMFGKFAGDIRSSLKFYM